MSKIANPFERFEIKQAKFDPTENYGKFVISPLERGFGVTLGNTLRRVLLSSLPGASTYAVEVSGAQHEFSALDGVEEDVTTIILNLKQLVLKIDLEDADNHVLEINVTGPKTVTGKDIDCPTGVTIVNPEVELAHVAVGGKLSMKLHVRNGRGFFTAEKNKILFKDTPVGFILTDSNYSPVIKAAYSVEYTRVGHDSSYEELTLEVWTNGSMLPQDALSYASKILIEHFNKFLNVGDITEDITIEKDIVEEVEEAPTDASIDDLDLSIRSINCLKRANILTVLALADHTREDMMKIKNLGKKSFKEIEDKLAARGLSFKNE